MPRNNPGLRCVCWLHRTLVGMVSNVSRWELVQQPLSKLLAEQNVRDTVPTNVRYNQKKNTSQSYATV